MEEKEIIIQGWHIAAFVLFYFAGLLTWSVVCAIKVNNAYNNAKKEENEAKNDYGSDDY